MANIVLNRRFAVAESLRGDHAPIDMSTMYGYVTGDSEGVSRGRYAQLVYIVGSETTSASGANFVDTAVANTTYVASTTFYGGSATVLIPPANLKYLEIYNNSTNSCYVLPLSTTNVNTITGQGMIVTQYAFYSLSRTIPAVTIGLDVGKSADLRIIGHYVV
jgi:hypothetical protein